MRKGFVIAGLAVSLLTARAASAQPLERSTRLAADVYVTAMAADWVTTQAILAQGGYESDPIAKPFVGHGVGPTLIGATIDSLFTFTAVKLAAHHRKAGKVMLWVAAGARSAIVLHNARVLQE